MSEKIGVWTGRHPAFEEALRALYHPEWLTAPALAPAAKWHYGFDCEYRLVGAIGARAGWRRSPWYRGRSRMSDFFLRLVAAGLKKPAPERCSRDNAGSLRLMLEIGYGFTHISGGLIVAAPEGGDRKRLAELTVTAHESQRYKLIRHRAKLRLSALSEQLSTPDPDDFLWI